MTRQEALTLDQAVGRLEEAIETLKQQVPALQDNVSRLWTTVEVMSATATAGEKAHENDASNAKEARASLDSIITQAIAAAATTARETVAAEAKMAREQLETTARERKSDRRWTQERLLQVIVPLLTMMIGSGLTLVLALHGSWH